MARDTIADKGKQIATNSDDFGQGPIDLRSLSLIQALKLATLAQAKANGDLLKSHSKDKELIILVGDVLEKILPSFKLDTSNPFDNLKSMLNVVGSHFESLEKASDTKVLNQFNDMRLKTFLKMIGDDRVTLVTPMKSIQDALDEGGWIYKSC